MSNNPNEVNNFEQLMYKYLKDKDQMLNNYDYQTPLKEISPIEPLIFQNDIMPRNNQFDMNMQNFNPRFEKDINIPNNLSNRSDYIGMNDNNKFITPSKPNNKNSSNINSFINSSIEREKALKEEKKKKQMEYQKMLDEQIKEKRLRQQKEKEKRLQEELLYEEKLKLEKEKFERENNQNKNNKFQNNNLFSREEPMQIKAKMPQFSKNLMMDNEMEENLQNEMMNNAMKRANSQKYLEIMNNNIFPQNQNPKYPPNPQYREDGEEESPENFILQNQNLNQNIPPQQISIEHLVSTSSQIPGQILNPLNQNHPQYKTQNNYYPGSRQNPQNVIPNLNNMNYPQTQPSAQDLNPYMTQRQYYESRQKLHRMPSTDTNISIAPSNFPTSYQIPFNNNLINSSPNPINFNNNSQNVNELLNMNINNQNYFGKIMEIFFHEQEKILESYKETIEKLKNERDEAIYKNKANEQKILALQKLQNDQENLEKNLGYFPFKNNYQQNMEKTLDSIMQKNEDFKYNNDNENKIMNINLNENDNKKIETSLNNINNNSNISDSKLVSLITSTKFVKVNNGDGKKLLETWKKEEEDDNKNNNNYNYNYDYKEVKEHLNNNNQNLNENNKDNTNDNNNNKYKLSGMDTNAFMEKINMINNKILEPPDEPKNYIEDSIISKTQKNDEKSFANEISNRNVKEEINNISTNNNIDDIDKDNIISSKNNDIINNYISNDINAKENKFNNFNYKDNIINESDINMQKYMAEMKGKDVMLNNVHKAVMQNLDNNISISTQIKEKLEEKKKQQEINNNNNAIKISVIAEKEYQGIFRDSEDEEKKNKYNNYSIKQVNCSNSKLIKIADSNDEMQKKERDSILINPPLKNIDNNVTISKSKNNYSLFVSKHVKNEEKNPYENIVSINNEEETQNNNINNKNINININIPEGEENNDLPNLDSPKNDYKTVQTFGIPNNNNNNSVANKNENNNTSKSIAKKEEEIINRLNFFEDDDNILASKIKLDKKESKNNNINNINIDNDSFLKNNSNLMYNNKNNESKHSVRPPTDLTGDKITSLNNLYDEFKKKKDHINETNSISNNNINNIGNNSLMNESLNTFTQNLNIKWKDLTKKDINNIKMNREQLYNDDNNYSNLDDDDNFKDEKIFDKVNQFTRVALNELKQSQLSVFSKDKTIKKYE